MMRVFVCTDHDGHYPVGVASVVIAESESEARSLLDVELRRNGLKDSLVNPYGLREVPLVAAAIVLNNGDY